jgi:hypothetical protein
LQGTVNPSVYDLRVFESHRPHFHRESNLVFSPHNPLKNPLQLRKFYANGQLKLAQTKTNLHFSLLSLSIHISIRFFHQIISQMRKICVILSLRISQTIDVLTKSSQIARDYLSLACVFLVHFDILKSFLEVV